MVKKRKKINKAKVFVVNRFETSSGLNEVIFSKTGNLNRGKIKKFSRFPDALRFGKKKAKFLKGNLVVAK